MQNNNKIFGNLYEIQALIENVSGEQASLCTKHSMRWFWLYKQQEQKVRRETDAENGLPAMPHHIIHRARNQN